MNAIIAIEKPSERGDPAELTIMLIACTEDIERFTRQKAVDKLSQDFDSAVRESTKRVYAEVLESVSGANDNGGWTTSAQALVGGVREAKKMMFAVAAWLFDNGYEVTLAGGN